MWFYISQFSSFRIMLSSFCSGNKMNCRKYLLIVTKIQIKFFSIVRHKPQVSFTFIIFTKLGNSNPTTSRHWQYPFAAGPFSSNKTNTQFSESQIKGKHGTLAFLLLGYRKRGRYYFLPPLVSVGQWFICIFPILANLHNWICLCLFLFLCRLFFPPNFLGLRPERCWLSNNLLGLLRNSYKQLTQKINLSKTSWS